VILVLGLWGSSVYACGGLGCKGGNWGCKSAGCSEAAPEGENRSCRLCDPFDPLETPVCGCFKGACKQTPAGPGLELQVQYSVSAGDPNDIFAVGNTLTVTRSSSFGRLAEYFNPWNAGTETVTVPSFTSTIKITGQHATDPDVRFFDVTSLTVNIPSFSSYAYNGGQTGANALSLANSGQGEVDIATGDFAVDFTASFTNNEFSSAAPARAEGSVWGTFGRSGSALLDYELEGFANAE